MGVRLVSEGAERQLDVGREVIVAGGAILSPQLLMLSGIGDTAPSPGCIGYRGQMGRLPGCGYQLSRSPGRRRADGNAGLVFVGISWGAAPKNVANILVYALFRTGPLSSNVFESTGFVRTLPALPRPDVQIVFQAARRNRGTFPFPLGHGFAINIVGLYPKSRGQVRLASADPLVAPLVDPQLLSNSDDIATLLRGFKLGRQISRAEPFARYRAHV